jgi:pentatricopeptide repeat protein
MQRMGFKIGHFTLGSVLKVCGNVSFSEQGKQVHAYIIKSGHESNVFMISAILDMYAKCGRMDYSQQLFDEVPEQGEVLWNSLITGYAQNGHGEETLKHFFQMQWAGLKANHFTFGSVLKACSSVANPEHGKRIHSFIIKTGFESDILVGSAIVDMYAKCGVTEDARTMFYKMPERNVVTWNTIIAGFCQVVDAEEALNYFCEMQQTGIKPNHFTVSSVLRACTSIASLDYGRQVHAHIIKNSSDIDEFVGSSLVDMYAKCGAIDDACKWFEKMPKCDIVSWNTMVAGYAQNGLGEEASRLFHKVLTAGIKPDQSTFTSILSVSASIAALDQGKQVHAYTIKVGFEPWVVVGNALVGMYAKCGSIDEACNVFEEMPERDMISWTTLISGYAQHGCGKEALQIFEQMQDKGIKPNDITFVAVLSACSHVGLVDEGCHYFNSMTKDHGIAPRLDHYACVVDLLGRAGLLNEAENFIKKMKLKADAVMWRALLSACKIHGNVDIGQRAAEHILELEPHDASTYILLSNMYSLAGKWDDATRIRNMMKIEGVKKEPGLSWIEVSNAVHSFAVRDTSHPQTASIYAKLERLLKQMKEAGYVPETNFAMYDMEYE